MKKNRINKYDYLVCEYRNYRSSVTEGSIQHRFSKDWLDDIIPSFYRKFRTRISTDMMMFMFDEKGNLVPIERTFKKTKNYIEMISDFESSCSYKPFQRDLSPMFDKDYKGDSMYYIPSIDTSVDITKSESHIVLSDYYFNFLKFLHRWKEDLLEMMGGVMFGVTFQKLYTTLGVILNDEEKKHKYLPELMSFMKDESKGKTYENIMLGLSLREQTFTEPILGSFHQYGYPVIDGIPYMRLDKMWSDGKGVFNRLFDMDDEDEVTIFRSTSRESEILGSSWSPLLDMSLGWGARRSDNGKMFLVSTTIKKKDIFFLNTWTSDETLDNYSEIVIPYDILTMDDVNVIEMDLLNKKKTIKQLKSFGNTWLGDIKNHKYWFNGALNKMIHKRRKLSRKMKTDFPFESLPQEFLLRLWNNVKKKYKGIIDTNDLKNVIGLDKEYSIKHTDLGQFSNEEKYEISINMNLKPQRLSATEIGFPDAKYVGDDIYY